MIQGILAVILLAMFIIALLIWFLQLIWLITPFRPFKYLCHDILQWHESEESRWQEEGYISICKHCGKQIVSDGIGGWIEK